MNGSMMDNEAGSLDNVLTLDTNDDKFKDQVSNWEDGGTYPITGGSIRQVSPGKYEVLEMEFGEAPAEEETEAPAPPAKGATGNPAVDKMVADEAA